MAAHLSPEPSCKTRSKPDRVSSLSRRLCMMAAHLSRAVLLCALAAALVAGGSCRHDHMLPGSHNLVGDPIAEGAAPCPPKRVPGLVGRIVKPPGAQRRRLDRRQSPGPDTYIDVLIVVGTTPLTEERGLAAVAAQSVVLIDKANEALANSGVLAPSRFRLAATEQVAYTESADAFGRDPHAFMSGSAEVARLRELHRADLVAFFCTNGHCGGALQSFSGTATLGNLGNPEYDFQSDFSSVWVHGDGGHWPETEPYASVATSTTFLDHFSRISPCHPTHAV